MIYDFDTTLPSSFKIPVHPSNGKGKHCFIYKCFKDVKQELGLENKKVLLKVFYIEPLKNGEVENVNWGDDPKDGNPRKNTTLFEATQIQNICYWEGLAPQVHAIIIVKWKGKEYLAQVTDDLGTNFKETHKDAQFTYDKVKELGKKYGFANDRDDVSMWDVIDDKLIDFQTFAFNQDYIPFLKDYYSNKTKWGKRYYHRIPELKLNGSPRNMETRLTEMNLDEFDFEGKSVLDIGCSGGVFINHVLEKNARVAIGVDFPDVIEGARLMSNHLRYYNAQYYGIDLLNTTTEKLREIIGVKKFDYVFYLSMFRHTHFPSFIWELCKGTAIIEWNNWKTEEEIRDLVQTRFNIIREGRTTDHGTGKPFYICKPK